MTHTLTTSKGTFLFVGVLIESKSFKVHDPSRVFKTKDRYLEFIIDRKYDRIFIPELNELHFDDIKILTRTSKITEDQAREVVDPDFESPNINVCLMKLRSLMQAERLYTSNIYTQPDADSSKEHTDAYNEMQSRTFPDWLIIKVIC